MIRVEMSDEKFVDWCNAQGDDVWLDDSEGYVVKVIADDVVIAKIIHGQKYIETSRGQPIGQA